MRQVGSVEVPQEAFMSVLKLDEDWFYEWKETGIIYSYPFLWSYLFLLRFRKGLLSWRVCLKISRTIKRRTWCTSSSYNENYLYRRRNSKYSFFKTIRYLIKYGWSFCRWWYSRIYNRSQSWISNAR